MTLIALAVYFVALLFGYILTETKLRLAQFKFLDFKPFSCRKCLSFWLIMFTSALSFICGQGYIGVLLFIFAILTALAMTIDERMKETLTDEEIRNLNKQDK